jgi:hypothetical protein
LSTFGADDAAAPPEPLLPQAARPAVTAARAATRSRALDLLGIGILSGWRG